MEENRTHTAYTEKMRVVINFLRERNLFQMTQRMSEERVKT